MPHCLLFQQKIPGREIVFLERLTIVEDEIIVTDDETEQTVVLSGDEGVLPKKRPMASAERQAGMRMRKKQKTDGRKVMGADRDALFASLVRRGENTSGSEEANLLFLLRVGTCPSAGGSRAAVSRIISSYFHPQIHTAVVRLKEYLFPDPLNLTLQCCLGGYFFHVANIETSRWATESRRWK